MQIRLKSNFQLSVENNLGLPWFCFTSLCDWSRILAPLCQPIRCKTKSNHDLVARVFPRFEHFVCFYFDFLLALIGIFLSSEWPLLLQLRFYDTHSKSSLKIKFSKASLQCNCFSLLRSLIGLENLFFLLKCDTILLTSLSWSLAFSRPLNSYRRLVRLTSLLIGRRG